MEPLKSVEWVPGKWWLVRITGGDGSLTPVCQLPAQWRVIAGTKEVRLTVPAADVVQMGVRGSKA